MYKQQQKSIAAPNEIMLNDLLKEFQMKYIQWAEEYCKCACKKTFVDVLFRIREHSQ